MKLIHLSDLHLGKRVNEYSMLDDQEYILNEILKIIDDEKPDGVMIAGDVYDKSVPSAEAVTLLDGFLTALSSRGLQTLVVSGNHDSPERLSFGGRLLEKSGIHLSDLFGTCRGETKRVTLYDDHGPVHFYLLPFVKPVHVRRRFGEEVVSYTDAMRVLINAMAIDKQARNVLITHQFTAGAVRSDSEELSVGGSDQVDVHVFEDFDYVALGHIHKPQNCLGRRVRYAGTPLKYSFSEAQHEKSVTVVELSEKGTLSLRAVPLVPLRDMQELRGAYAELTRLDFYENTSYRDDYMHITLTDEEDIPDALGSLRTIYHNLMKLDYDNKRTRENREVEGDAEVEKRSPLALFADFYELQNNAPMSEEQEIYMKEIIEDIWEEEA